MDRRYFFKALAGIVGGVALEQAIPFNRVWSFPSKIRVASLHDQYIHGILPPNSGYAWAVESMDAATVSTPAPSLAVRFVQSWPACADCSGLHLER